MDAQSGKDITQVSREMAILEKESQRYLDLSAQIGDRFSAVLRNEPSDKTGDEQLRTDLVPMANEIRNIRESIEKGNNSLQDYLTKTEL